ESLRLTRRVKCRVRPSGVKAGPYSSAEVLMTPAANNSGALPDAGAGSDWRACCAEENERRNSTATNDSRGRRTMARFSLGMANILTIILIPGRGRMRVRAV